MRTEQAVSYDYTEAGYANTCDDSVVDIYDEGYATGHRPPGR